MTLYCEVCDVQVQSEITMRDHIKGKRHLRLSSALETQKRDAELSVYVRGFGKSTSIEDLKLYFSEFGKIDNFYMDSEKGVFAIIKYAEKAVVCRLLECNHRVKGKRLIVRQKEVKLWQRKKEKHSPESPNKTVTSSKSSNMCTIDYGGIMPTLKSCESVEKQMESLQSLLELPPDEINQRLRIQNELKDCFRPHFPNCSAHLFGSSVNGFGIIGCDIDLFLDLNLNSTDGNFEGSPSMLSRFIRSITNSDGRITYKQLHDVPTHEKINLLLRLLRNAGGGFDNFLYIPSKRCPFIRCTHSETNTKCDISINNHLALRNSRLLQFYSLIDSRVRPLLYSIRYWAKLRKIAGDGDNGWLTNYALSFLVIYYLQSKEPPVLPSVATLWELSTEKASVDGWDCSFVEDLDSVPKSQNKSSACELLVGFFKYFKSFDFNCYVMCARTSRLMDVVQFAQYMKSDEKMDKFKISEMCFQDPFVLDHNITGNINKKTFVKIVGEFQAAAHQVEFLDFETISQEGLSGLPLLFSENTIVSHEGHQPSAEDYPSQTCKADVPSYSFTIEMQVSDLSRQFLESCSSLDAMKRTWCKKVCAFVQKTLHELLRFQTRVKSNTISTKRDGEAVSSSIVHVDKPNTGAEKLSSKLVVNYPRDGSNSVTPLKRPASSSCCEEELSQKRHKVEIGGKNESSGIIHNTASGSCASPSREELLKGAIESNQSGSGQISKVSRKDSEEETVTIHLSTAHRVWLNRKPFQKQVRQTRDYDFDMERKVTELMLQDTTCMDQFGSFECDLNITESIQLKSACIRFNFGAPSNEKELSAFVLFFKSFLLKLIAICKPEDIENKHWSPILAV